MTGLTRMTSAKYLRNSCTLTAHTLRPHFVPFILVRPVIVQFEIIFVMALSVCGLMCDQFLSPQAPVLWMLMDQRTQLRPAFDEF